MINLKKVKKLDYPYPIIIVDNFIDEKFLNKILNEFPKNDEFIKFKKTMVNRRFLSNDNPDFYNYINKNKYWFELYNTVNNYEFYEKIINLLINDNSNNKLINMPFFKNFYRKNKIKFNLSYYLREIIQKIPRINFLNYLRKISKNFLYKNEDNSGVYLRFDISSASNGYFRTPHKDSDGTIFAFLIYLEDQINIGGSGGDFVINDRKFEVFQSIKPQKNRAIFFLSNKNSFHSVSEMKNAIGWRKFVYGGFTSVDKLIWSKI